MAKNQEAMKEIKWYRPDSHDGERTLSQHAYVEAIRENRIRAYIGNRALCDSRKGLIDESGQFLDFGSIEPEELNQTKACKKCLRLADTLNKRKHV